MPRTRPSSPSPASPLCGQPPFRLGHSWQCVLTEVGLAAGSGPRLAALELADITGSADVQAFRDVGFESVCLFVLISYFCPTACSPKSYGSGMLACFPSPCSEPLDWTHVFPRFVFLAAPPTPGGRRRETLGMDMAPPAAVATHCIWSGRLKGLDAVAGS